MIEIVIEIDSQFDEKDPLLIRAILAQLEQKKRETQARVTTVWAIPVQEAIIAKVESDISIVLHALHLAEESEKESRKKLCT